MPNYSIARLVITQMACLAMIILVSTAVLADARAPSLLTVSAKAPQTPTPMPPPSPSVSALTPMPPPSPSVSAPTQIPPAVADARAPSLLTVSAKARQTPTPTPPSSPSVSAPPQSPTPPPSPSVSAPPASPRPPPSPSVTSVDEQETEIPDLIEEDYGIWDPAPYFRGGSWAPIPHAAPGALNPSSAYGSNSPDLGPGLKLQVSPD